MKTIYNIKLGESAFVGPMEFFRVPGGWVAISAMSSCFIPWHNEFHEESK